MKVYLVRHREVLVTTYRVEAENEDDAYEAVQYGDGEEIDRDTESIPPGDEAWECDEEEA